MLLLLRVPFPILCWVISSVSITSAMSLCVQDPTRTSLLNPGAMQTPYWKLLCGPWAPQIQYAKRENPVPLPQGCSSTELPAQLMANPFSSASRIPGHHSQLPSPTLRRYRVLLFHLQNISRVLLLSCFSATDAIYLGDLFIQESTCLTSTLAWITE